jgi:Ser/Thr protein kinase RdoA (MazF antagonist)
LAFEVDVARRLAESAAPVAEPDPRVEPRVHRRDDFAVTLWTYYEAVPPLDFAPAEYTDALAHLHAGMRQVEMPSPHFTDRVSGALQLLADPDETPELPDTDRELLQTTLCRLSDAITASGRREQLLHGEPHPGNLLRTRRGPLFIDLETCCRGPVEFDLAHGLLAHENQSALTVDELSEHYPGVDRDVIEQARALIWAMVTTWRWQHGDELPNGRYWRVEGLNQLRRARAAIAVAAKFR